ncbi:uncharacterized protein LOC113351913 [Papaver somniferum]|uniref:uncharacterized protein LOC113351913 n=1 Tax=Papaver somniferum TaxID=3469 RepID=UPI000E6FCCBB|nr:uncharacterized protein LOC113351913 [Papaver somniferum]
MMGFPHVRSMLHRAQVTRAIQASGDLFIFHDARGIVALRARWFIPTHTFICIWGEFTITLEDVIALLHLPVTGNLPESISAEETAISNILTAKMEEINKASDNKGCYAHWLKRWWPKDEVSDSPIDDSSVSNGFMKIECYANMMFLQALMWEHFKNYAHIPRTVLQGLNANSRHIFSENNNARMMRWSTKKPRIKARLIDVLDDESEFDFRPWVSTPPYISQLTTFNTRKSMALASGAGLSDGERSYMSSCTPGHLLSAIYGELSVM